MSCLFSPPVFYFNIMKYLINKKTGKKFCVHCDSYECICLPESEKYFDFNFSTVLKIKGIFFISPKADKLIFYKQKLQNGRIIKSNSELIVPNGKYYILHNYPKIEIYLSNDIINSSFKN